MRILTVSGRVVADAEKRSTTNGREFITFRLANNEFTDEKDANGNLITHWYSVISSDSRVINSIKYLTKGRPVNVVGDYTDKIYQNKQGVCDISRDIVAHAVYFQLGSKDENGGNSTAATKTASDEMPKVTASTATTAAPKASTKPQVTIDDDDDELPF